MENRIKFLPGQQKIFLQSVQTKSRLHPDELAKLAGIVPRSYRDWKREKMNITLAAGLFFQKKFGILLPENPEAMVLRWKEFKILLSRKGGIACYRKHGSPGTIEGRKKGGVKALSILRAKGIVPERKKYDLPSKYNEELAEFVGILLGDGGITREQTAITLNSEADKDYVLYVNELENKLFNARPKNIKRNDSKAIVIYLNGINLVDYLIKIGLKVGNKVKQQVDVPDWIKKSKEFRIACVRGLMDTDGGVFLHKYKVNGKVYAYKKICFTNRSVPLLIFVNDVLEEIGLTPKLITKVENKKVWLYNKQEVEQYLNTIGSHNSRLLKYQN